MMGCSSKTPSLPCLQAAGAKAGPLPPAAPSPVPPGSASAAPLQKLALATGGAEKSWERCVCPFGAVALVVGLAATCITFSINGPRMDIAKVVSVATLLFGAALLAAALLCWRAKRRRRRRRQQQQQQQQQQQGAPAGGGPEHQAAGGAVL